MRYMKQIRTGKIAVYDADLIETGRWEEVTAEQAKAPKPTDDEVSVKDEIKITVTRGNKKATKKDGDVPTDH